MLFKTRILPNLSRLGSVVDRLLGDLCGGPSFWGSSIEALDRKGVKLSFFFDVETVPEETSSIVGAVVIILGAMKLVSTDLPKFQTYQESQGD